MTVVAPTNPDLVSDDLVNRLKRSVFASIPDFDFKRLKKSLIADFDAYTAEYKRPNSGQLRSAIGRLYRLTAKAESNRTDAYARLAKEISALNPGVRELLESYGTADISIPTSEEIRSLNKDHRREAVQNLLSILRMGGKYATSRNRPSRLLKKA